jgi:hypothetical protein
LDALALFCDAQQLTINPGKTKVMNFNGFKKTSDLNFFFRRKEIEITDTYTYLGVQLSGPCFSFQPTLQLQINKGYRSLALLER